MWNRKELKNVAKDKIGKNLLMSLLTAFVTIIVTIVLNIVAYNSYGLLGSVVYFAFVLLVYDPLLVGISKFYMDNPGSNLSDIFFAFDGGKYANVISVCFMKGLKIFLWSLLFVIPGIVKMYELLYTDYILIENPDMDYKEVFAKSKELTSNRKFDLFILQLSFFLWGMLSWIPVLNLYVMSYIDQTTVESYHFAKNNSLNY